MIIIQCPKCEDVKDNLLVVGTRETLGVLVIHFRCNHCGHDFEKYMRRGFSAQ